MCNELLTDTHPGWGSFSLPGDTLKAIPEIAWRIPNLDAYARIEILNGTSDVAACLQAQLKNGWTTEHIAVKWSTGLITLLAVLLAVLQSIRKRSSSPAMWRWFEWLNLFQNAAAAGLMNLNYPGLYVSFARNFAWSLGLLSSASIQNAINKWRKSSGGKLTYLVYNDVPSINNTITGGFDLTKVIDNLNNGTLNLNNTTLTDDGLSINIRRQVADGISRAAMDNTAQQNGTSIVPPGLPHYINSTNIPYPNGMSTLFIWMLVILGLVIALNIVILVVVLLLSIFGKHSPQWIKQLRRRFPYFFAGNLLRYCLGFSFPVALLSLYQFKLNKSDATIPIIMACVGWFISIIPLIVIYIVVLVKDRNTSEKNPSVSFLWTNYQMFHSVGFLYRPFKENECGFWFKTIVMGQISKAAFIVFGGKNQWAQVIGCVVVEFICCLWCIIFRPYRGVWNNILGSLLAFMRLVLFSLLIPYINSIKVASIPRTGMGIAQIVMVALSAVLLLIDMIWTAIYDLFHFNRRIDDYEHLESPYEDENPYNDDASVQQKLVGERSMSPGPRNPYEYNDEYKDVLKEEVSSNGAGVGADMSPTNGGRIKLQQQQQQEFQYNRHTYYNDPYQNDHPSRFSFDFDYGVRPQPGVQTNSRHAY
jgi:hypothetical protein